MSNWFQQITRERKELPEIHGCHNDRIFEGFSDFQKQIEFSDFCISVFLNFCNIFGFLAIYRERKSYWRSAGVKMTRSTRTFQISKEKFILGFLYFCISVFFGLLAIFRERKELPDIYQIFKGYSNFKKRRKKGFLNFCISVFLNFVNGIGRGF